MAGEQVMRGWDGWYAYNPYFRTGFGPHTVDVVIVPSDWRSGLYPQTRVMKGRTPFEALYRLRQNLKSEGHRP